MATSTTGSEAEGACGGRREKRWRLAAATDDTALAVAAALLGALALLRVNELACCTGEARRTRALAADGTRAAPTAIVQAHRALEGKRLAMSARVARMARARALVRAAGCAAVRTPLPPVYAHGDARAMPATSTIALVGWHRTLDALPAAIARAKALDALAVRVAVGGAARRRVLASGACEARRAHTHLAEAVAAPRAAQRTSRPSATRQEAENLPNRRSDARRPTAGGVGARGRREAIAAEASALARVTLSRGHAHAGHACAVSRASHRAADGEGEVAHVASVARVALACAARRVARAVPGAVGWAGGQHRGARATAKAGVARALASVAVAMG